MSCILGARYTMTAEVGTQTSVQTDSGQIKRVWSYDDSIDCTARTIKSAGIRAVGSTETWTEEYEDVEWVRVSTDVLLTKRHRLKDIKDSKGTIRWPGQFEIQGIEPKLDPFNNFVEYELLIKKAEVQ